MYVHQKVFFIYENKIREGIIIAVTERTTANFKTIAELVALESTSSIEVKDYSCEVAFVQDGKVMTKTLPEEDCSTSVWGFEKSVVKLPEIEEKKEEIK